MLEAGASLHARPIDARSLALWVVAQEARGLLTRLARVEPFALHSPMVPAAAISPAAQTGIERYLAKERHELRGRLGQYMAWLDGPEAMPAEAQRRFTFLRMRFNAVLHQFYIFSDVMTQRAEHETGVWLAGLDAVAADALALPACHFAAPPVVCFLDRGPGAAIRRAKTKMPGGGENPVAIIRVPRERMVGSGLASSLCHEVGHQVTALLGLIGSLTPKLSQLRNDRPEQAPAWDLYSRWLSEVLADFWSVVRVGVSSTIGLLGVMSLPRVFVFRLNLDDPHPMPWFRVKLSAEMGRAVYPHAQWERLAEVWESFFPLDEVDPRVRQLLELLRETMPEYVSILVKHRPPSLGGRTLPEAARVEERQPGRLLDWFERWRERPAEMRRAPPSLVFAAIGQAKASGRISPERESDCLTYLLKDWALRNTIDQSAACAANPAPQRCWPGSRLQKVH